MTDGVSERGRPPKLFRIIKARPHLFTSAMTSLVVFGALAFTDWRVPTRLLAAWDIGVLLYLVATWHAMTRSDVHTIRRRARQQDEGQRVILVLATLAALASLGAILALLGATREGPRPLLQLAFAGATILLSWAFTHAIFALHYAHEFYDERRGAETCLRFPDPEPNPDYWDFMYFSFVIGMCAQVSDISVASKPVRRTVFVHSVIAFVFNAALLALTVNLAASAI